MPIGVLSAVAGIVGSTDLHGRAGCLRSFLHHRSTCKFMLPLISWTCRMGKPQDALLPSFTFGLAAYLARLPAAYSKAVTRLRSYGSCQRRVTDWLFSSIRKGRPPSGSCLLGPGCSLISGSFIVETISVFRYGTTFRQCSHHWTNFSWVYPLFGFLIVVMNLLADLLTFDARLTGDNE